MRIVPILITKIIYIQAMPVSEEYWLSGFDIVLLFYFSIIISPHPNEFKVFLPYTTNSILQFDNTCHIVHKPVTEQQYHQNYLHIWLILCKIWNTSVCSSVDRVAHSECEGRQFESAQTHQKSPRTSKSRAFWWS